MTTILDKSIIHLLHRASQRATEIFAAQVPLLPDVTARQYAVLAAVAGHEGASQTELIRLTGIDRSTLSDVVQRMVRRGWLERRRADGDGRRNTITLSENGRDMLGIIKPRAKRAEKIILEHLGKEDALHVTAILAKFVGRPDQAQEEV